MNELTHNKTTVDLTGVPETMLWPLWNRANEAKRADSLIDDPMTINLMQQIDYPFREMFGKPNVAHAIRARYGDDLIKAFLKKHPKGSIVALGEGVETQFWRLHHPTVQWYSVDVAESIEFRRRLLPVDQRNILIAKSALDESWLTEVPNNQPVFISAAGLLMYFEPEQVITLFRAITQRFQELEMYFDTIPPWFSRKSLKGFKVTEKYTAPPMPFGIKLCDVPSFFEQVPHLKVVSAVSYAEPFPQRMFPYSFLTRIAWLKNTLSPGLVHLVRIPE